MKEDTVRIEQGVPEAEEEECAALDDPEADEEEDAAEDPEAEEDRDEAALEDASINGTKAHRHMRKKSWPEE